MRLLRIAMNGEEHPNYTITKCFNQEFMFVETIWWQRYSDSEYEKLNADILTRFEAGKFDVVFMQIQGGGIIFPDTAKKMAESAIVFNWTGDVRNTLAHFEELGAHVVTLFTNLTEVGQMQLLGYKADYLQVGYDTAYYRRMQLKRNKNIVFCGNYYKDSDFPLSGFRAECALALQREFGNQFQLYGEGWENAGIISRGSVNNEEEAVLYNTCGVAISISHYAYGLYFSDRLLREMACGAPVLSHRYPLCETQFDEYKNIVFFNDPADLIKKCHWILDNQEKADSYGFDAAAHVREFYTWECFVKNFKMLINKHW